MTAENEKRRINDPSFFVFTPSKRTDFYPKKRHAGNPAFFCFFASFDGAKIIKAQKRLHAPLCRLPKNSKNDGPWRRRFWLFFFKKGVSFLLFIYKENRGRKARFMREVFGQQPTKTQVLYKETGKKCRFLRSKR